MDDRSVKVCWRGKLSIIKLGSFIRFMKGLINLERNDEECKQQTNHCLR